MVKCTFTGREEHAHKGVHLIKNDGSVEYYSSSKAIRNALKLKRDKRKIKWTEAYRINRAKIVAAESKENVGETKQEQAPAEAKKSKKSSKKSN